MPLWRISSRSYAAATTAFPRALAIAVTLIAICEFGFSASTVLLYPEPASDSASYLAFSPVRPHNYSLFIAGYRELFSSDLAYLPMVQLALVIVANAFLALAVGCRLNSALAAFVTLGILYWFTSASDAVYLQSEAIYTPAVTGA